ncbi:phosphoribosylanthranilate isomerase [Flavobacterium selenitireducens]|uniref:phosphoribosylanthranilate isomerase n=1 Tax=Flavobacterium selenitireducens TaxID=2722704 RepID=UPI00168AF513|nr:phosphoribosylanthranilate isomerase [Flavobacterium selenitireducens]MBD3583822.1 phosphoribosylanthranilate isomerase [Flavobacterium selenitireducens]
MKIKVCGMKFRENIESVCALSPDFIGFIFWEKSLRHFQGPTPEIPKAIKKVGVFVDATESEILEKAAHYGLDLVQLHGAESPMFCASIRKSGLGLIKAFALDRDFDFSILEDFEPYCDFFLFDTKGKLPGGNGIAFDWELLRKYDGPKPIFLSGGIAPESASALKNLGIPILAADINSQFEIAPGLKNVEAIKQFKYALK